MICCRSPGWKLQGDTRLASLAAFQGSCVSVLWLPSHKSTNWGLQATHGSCLTVPEAIGLKSVRGATIPQKVLEEEPSLPHLAFGGCQPALVLLSLWTHPCSLSPGLRVTFSLHVTMSRFLE